jgi:hypothetical protein
MTLSSSQVALLQEGIALAAELPAHRPGHRRFVVVHPFKDKGAREAGYEALPWRYRVHSYELAAALVEEAPSSSLAAEQRDRTFDDVAEVDVALLEERAPASLFVEKRRTAAPL